MNFEELGVENRVSALTEKLGISVPTEIQKKAIPAAFRNRDIVAIAKTGTGKTLTYVLPILSKLIKKKTAFYALVVAPTRELCMQIKDEFNKLSKDLGISVCVAIGGTPVKTIVKAFEQRPNIVVGTPERVYEVTSEMRKNPFDLLKYFVVDEIDGILEFKKQKELLSIIHDLPKKRRTLVCSATVSNESKNFIAKIMKDPIEIDTVREYKMADKILQQLLFVPEKHASAYLYYLLSKKVDKSALVFTSRCFTAQMLAEVMRNMKIETYCIHGKLDHEKRINVLDGFKKNAGSVLFATDVAARGLDIDHIDLVVNYDVPANAKQYVHRIGRTARAGRSGRAITFVTQYKIQEWQTIEANLGIHLDVFAIDSREKVLFYLDELKEHERNAAEKTKETLVKKKGSRK